MDDAAKSDRMEAIAYNRARVEGQATRRASATALSAERSIGTSKQEDFA